MGFHIYQKISDSKLEIVRDDHSQPFEFDTYHEALDHLLKSKLTHDWAKGRIVIEQARDQETA